MKLIKITNKLDEKEFKRLIEYNYGWNNLSNIKNKIITTIMKNKELTVKNEVIIRELDMLGIISTKNEKQN